jgi:DNA invertase Pin-like site-specific DNA recombinase
VFEPGEAHYRTTLTWTDVEEIRRRLATGEPQKAIAKDFGISQSTVSRIGNQETWRTQRHRPQSHTPAEDPSIT